jgi:hypothetical protein
MPLTASQGDDVTVSNKINRHKLAASVETGNNPCKRIFLSSFLLELRYCCVWKNRQSKRNACLLLFRYEYYLFSQYFGSLVLKSYLI